MSSATLNSKTSFEYVIVDGFEAKDQIQNEAQDHNSNSLDENGNNQYDEKEPSSPLKATSASSQMKLGYMYHCGEGVSVDYKLAMEWYLKAHNNGNTNATSNIGYMYSKGLGVKADDQLALKWYLKAANKGNAYAQNNVGYSYENGIGTKKDVILALEWYEKSAGQGFERAKNNLVRLKKQGCVQRENGLAEQNELKFSNERSLESKREIDHSDINMLKTEMVPLNLAKDEKKTTMFERLLSMLAIGEDKAGNYVFYYG